jgi:simple sugar transport system substrate-binding protein
MKLVKATMLATAMMLGAAGLASAETRIIVVSHGPANDPYHSVVKNGIQQAAEDLDLVVDYRAPETFDMVKMSQLIDAAVTQAPDGLIVTIPTPAALSESIKRATAAGIPVIAFNSGLEVYKDLGVLAFIGQDEYQNGEAAGAAFKELGGKNAICLNHEVGSAVQDMRCEGLAAGFAPGTVTVVPGKPDPTENYAKAKAALSTDPTIDSIYCTSTVLCAEPAVKAVREAGSKALVGSTSMTPGFLKLVEDGEAGFATDAQQFQQGYLAVLLMNNYLRFHTLPVEPIVTGPTIITKDKTANLADLAAKGYR